MQWTKGKDQYFICLQYIAVLFISIAAVVSFLQWMNIKANELCKISKNVSGIYASELCTAVCLSVLVYTLYDRVYFPSQ
jgi:hypothetical protein